MCGRNISNEKSSSIGHERRFNYALQPMSRDTFVAMMTTDLPEAPAYFSRDAQINLEGPQLLQELEPPKPLNPADVKTLQDTGALILDTRAAQDYGNGHVPGSLNISLNGQFASWAGSLIPLETSIVIVSEDEAGVREAQTRLARVGIEHVVGYLDGGVLQWHNAGMTLATIEQISVQELKDRLSSNTVDTLIDVRRSNEWNNGHIDQARHIPLNHLSEEARTVDPHGRVAVICAGGFRSSLGTSVLERQGFTRISNVVGGMAAWQNTAH
jgi:rhodanese-related sulfurtransferase